MKKISPILLLLLAGCSAPPQQNAIEVSAVPVATAMNRSGDYLEASLQGQFRDSHIEIVSNQEKGVVLLRRQQGQWPARLHLRIRHQDKKLPRVFEVDLETSQHFIKVPMYYSSLSPKAKRRLMTVPMYNTDITKPLKNTLVKTTARSGKTHFQMSIPPEILRQNPGYLKVRWYQQRTAPAPRLRSARAI